MNVDIWTDPVCPWCHIGLERFVAALERFPGKDDVRVIHHTFQLDPSLPERYDGTEAEYLAQAKGIAPDQVEAMLDQVRAAGETDGLTFDFASLQVTNSRLAHHLVHLAQMRGVALPVMRDLMAAHFRDGENISDLQVLTRIGVEQGLDPKDVSEAVGSAQYDTAMRSDVHQAEGIGIQSVPFFVFAQKYALSGAQPAETFDRAFEMAAQDAASGGGCCGGGCCGGGAEEDRSDGCGGACGSDGGCSGGICGG